MRRETVTFAGSALRPDQYPRDGLPEVAFLGRSNVGKSSLLNAVAGVRGLARVSSTPGRTRLLNFFRAGNVFYLVDLPGYGYAKVSADEKRALGQAAELYLTTREPLALCVALVDVRHEPTPDDQELLAFLQESQRPFLVVATKADKLGRGELNRRLVALKHLGGEGVIATSAETGAGIGELWTRIRAAATAARGATR